MSGDQYNLRAFVDGLEEHEVVELIRLAVNEEPELIRKVDEFVRKHSMDVLACGEYYHSPDCAATMLHKDTLSVKAKKLAPDSMPSPCCLKPKPLRILDQGLSETEIWEVAKLVSQTSSLTNIVRTDSGKIEQSSSEAPTPPCKVILSSMDRLSSRRDY